MSGVLLNKGQEDVVDVYFTNNVNVHSILYIGLMIQTTNPSLNSTLGSGITEITGAGYGRIAINAVDWTRSGQVVQALPKTFTVGAGGWSSVNGYFIADTITGGNALMCECFAIEQQGDKYENDTIKVTAKYEQKDNSES